MTCGTHLSSSSSSHGPWTNLAVLVGRITHGRGAAGKGNRWRRGGEMLRQAWPLLSSSCNARMAGNEILCSHPNRLHPTVRDIGPFIKIERRTAPNKLPYVGPWPISAQATTLASSSWQLPSPLSLSCWLPSRRAIEHLDLGRQCC